MWKTEEEARRTWCSFYQVAVAGGDENAQEIDNRPLEMERSADGTWRRTGRLRPDCCCLASRCMAWRPGEARTHIVPPGEEKNLDYQPPEGWEAGPTTHLGTLYREPSHQVLGCCGRIHPNQNLIVRGF